MEDIATSAPKKDISSGKIFILCLGDLSRGFLYGIITTYMLTFFIPTTSGTTLPLFILNAGMVMAAIRCIGTVVDAFTDPWIASLSDRHEGRNGHRIPFMRASAIPYALCCALIFFPPVQQASWINALWVGVMLCLYYLFQTMYNIPYYALQVEVSSSSPRRRVFLFTISSLMFVVASALVYLTSTIKGVLMGAGFTELTSLRIPFVIFCALGALAALIPALIIREREYSTPHPYSVPLLASLKATFSYRNFTLMTIGYLIMWVAFAFFNATLVYYIENLLQLPSFYVTVVAGISVVAAVITYPLLNMLARRLGKKKLLMGACCAYAAIYLAIFFYQPVIASIGPVPFAIAIGVCIAFPIAITNIIPSAMFGDMAQYDTIKTGHHRSAMFVAARNFIEKLSQAVILLVIPNVLMLHSTDGAATAEGIQMTAMVAAVFVAAALFVYARYDEHEIMGVIEEDLARNHGGATVEIQEKA